MQGLAIACAAGTVAILAAKFALAARINVNWDEFYFLSQVYALLRGELDLLLQGPYTHAFRWIASTGGDEMDQILRLRLTMCALLAISAALTFAFARLWSSRVAALIAVLAFLASWPVLRHGASFRADSILLPLTLAAFYFALRGGPNARGDSVIAGVFLGLAFVVTVKAILLLPALILMAWLPGARQHGATLQSISSSARQTGLMLAVAAVVSVAALLLHGTQIVAVSEPAGTFASRSLASGILDVPLVPRRDYIVGLVGEDPIYWIAALAGLLVALWQRAFGLAAAALCFAPVLFYRNAYSYYFPVMMAPASVLVAVAAERLLVVRNARGRVLALATVALACLGLLNGAWNGVATLRFDGQAGERALVAAVHQVFPQPVPYLDHSGMIASFPKVNFFMSGWGIERYLQRGEDFMPGALQSRCPPLLLVNHSVLSPGALLFRQLRPRDRELIESRYVRHWGPIRVAGAAGDLGNGDPTSIRVPCTGRYRASSDGGFLLDGGSVGNGDVIELIGERDYRIEPAHPASSAFEFRLLWADAREPPAEAPPAMPVYEPL